MIRRIPHASRQCGGFAGGGGRAVLLASTGLTQTEAAALFQVDVRTVRRWLEGTRPTPKGAIERLNAWA